MGTNLQREEEEQLPTQRAADANIGRGAVRAQGDLPCTIDNVVAESAASYIRRGQENRSARLNEMLLSWKRRIDPRVRAAPPLPRVLLAQRS